MAGASIVLTAVLIYMAVYRNFAGLLRREIATESDLIAAAVELSGHDYLKSLEANPPAVRITLIDAEGTVLFDSGWDPSGMENHLDRPEVRSALETGVGEDARFSRTISRQTFYRAQRLGDGRVLRVAVTTDSIFASLLGLALLTALIASGVFVSAAVIGTGVTRRIVEPINRINLDRPEESPAYDEIAPLLSRMKKQNEIISAQIDEIRQRQIEFRAITDNMREGLLLLDCDARVLSCNKNALRLLQSNADDPVGKNALALNRSETFSRAVERALAGIPSEELTTPGERYLQIFANPVRDVDVVCGAVLVLLDVTEREDRERLRREFTANVSHELKTPLTAISGYAEIIANEVARHEDIPRFAGCIYAEAQRLITLVGDIMTLSRLDEGGVRTPREPVDLGHLVECAIQRTRAAAAKRGIEVAFSGGSAEINGIIRVIEEAVANVLDNAVKYNVDGGSVSIALAEKNGEITLEITDTGVGIPASEQGRIFERFYRADRSRGGAEGGTGLGLSIAKHAMKLHGGRIEVKSDGKHGSTVTLTFPAA
jgi:two-component system phosphate regulon sensor histidine kinase PhoR